MWLILLPRKGIPMSDDYNPWLWGGPVQTKATRSVTLIRNLWRNVAYEPPPLDIAERLNFFPFDVAKKANKLMGKESTNG